MRHTKTIAGPNIIVQVIHVTWNKAGRGAPTAERRNQIPSTLPLPANMQPDVGHHLLVHESHWGWPNDFANEISSKISTFNAADEFRYDCATIRSTSVGAELDWTWSDSGKPPRRKLDSAGNIVRVTHKSIAKENEWVRARWNARFSCVDTGNWWYEAVTVNVGVHPNANIPIDLFTSQEPVDDYSQMAYLR